MRKVIFAIGLISLFASCEKRQCYSCWVIRDNGYTTPTTTKYDYCDWTKDDAEGYVEMNTSQWNNGGVLATERASCSLK